MTTKAESKTAAACSDCRYWNKDASSEGECRRHAPQMLVFNVDVKQDLKFKSHFPHTAASDWCGDYLPK